MKATAVVSELEAVAEKLGIGVTYEALNAAVGRGGLCRLRQTYRIIVDKRASDSERIVTLASALASFDTSAIDMPAPVRQVLRTHEGSARIRLPLPPAATPAAVNPPTDTGADAATVLSSPSGAAGSATDNGNGAAA